MLYRKVALRFVVVLSVLLIAYLAATGAYWLGTCRLDKQISGIPERATQAQVRSILSGLHEVRVGLAQIPVGYEIARNEARKPSAKVYRYRLLVPTLDVIIVYDGDGRVSVVVPAYE